MTINRALIWLLFFMSSMFCLCREKCLFNIWKLVVTEFLSCACLCHTYRKCRRGFRTPCSIYVMERCKYEKKKCAHLVQNSQVVACHGTFHARLLLIRQHYGGPFYFAGRKLKQWRLAAENEGKAWTGERSEIRTIGNLCYCAAAWPLRNHRMFT